ncbi:MAG: efflux RND transporter periplasmic adaptor subunit [Lachnospiraceae bacterium]|nr:efflux RND transporter periplasmic adaptor subunit [Lachnospiraceae bacterium]MDE6992251.1 efflux RND transporter periplasmic adaptor subunit [Lachnospiraceae bacterium]MDE7000415.1 efflux RND transporter periplasmic adaptor subunit [Lachnospiraceae bacterium]
MSKGETKVQSAEGVKKAHRRRKKRLKIIIPVVLVLAALIGVKAFSSDGPTAIPVYTDQVSTGDIDTVLSVSGKVIAEESVTFFAPASAKVEGIEVSKGDVVKAGDVLLCFDEDAVAYAKQQTELAEKISSADYNSNVQYNNEQRTKLAQAEAEIAECEAWIDNYEKYIDDLTNGITDVTALKKSDLYAKKYSIEKEMNNYDLAMQFPTEETDVEMLARKKMEKQMELNQLNDELGLLSDYKTDYGWEDLLTQAKKDLADYEARLSEAKSVKAGAESAVVNGNKLAGYELNKTKSQLESADAEKKYEAALNGVVAGFNGVISDLNVVEGASVQEGAQLMVLESIDDVCVEFQASKYALETLALGQPAEITISGKDYTGTVSKINHVAEANSSGTPMVAVRVHIDNSDENIFLGIDAKLKILTASEKGVLQVPVEAVNVDSQGQFCYVIDNGILTKRYVTTGISSESFIQIIDGINEDQEIVTTSVYGIGLDEGMLVTAVSASGMPVTDMTEASDTVPSEENGAQQAESAESSTVQEDTEEAAEPQQNTEDGTDNG